MTAIKVFTSISTEINNLTRTFTNDVMRDVIINISPIAIGGLVLSLIWYAVLVINQQIEQPVQTMVANCLKIGIISGIVGAGGFYQSFLADIILDLPDEFAKIVFHNPDSSLSVADQTISLGFEKASEIVSSLSILGSGDIAVKLFCAIIIALSTLVLGLIGGGFLVLIKVQICLIVAVGPIFILAFLFQWSRNLFTNWLGEIIAYCVFSLMVTLIFVFMLKISEKYLLAIVEGDSLFMGSMCYALLVGIGCFLLFEAKNTALRLAGVISIGLAGVASDKGQSKANEGRKAAQAAVSRKLENWRKKK
jgi:type IV secretion system protein VirB6